MEETKSKPLSKRLSKFPFLGPFFFIANAYVSYGQSTHANNIAKLDEWKKRIGKGVLSSIILSAILLGIMLSVGVKLDHFDPEDAILKLYPNLLGFGIGVYALLFALPNEFLTKLIQARERSGDKSIGAEMLPVDMAYPLAVYCISIVFTMICSALPDSWFSLFVVTTLLFYGLYVTLELLKSIFTTSSLMLVVRKHEYLEAQSKTSDES